MAGRREPRPRRPHPFPGSPSDGTDHGRGDEAEGARRRPQPAAFGPPGHRRSADRRAGRHRCRHVRTVRRPHVRQVRRPTRRHRRRTHRQLPVRQRPRLAAATRRRSSRDAQVGGVSSKRPQSANVFEGYDPTSTHRGAKPLSALGIEHADHCGESCHLVVISGSRHQRPDMAPWCAHPRRHITKGASDVQVDDDCARVVSPDDDRAAAEREGKRLAKAARTRRDDFARQAIAAKLSGRDLSDFVLPVLFDVAGQTELTAAGKLLQVDPHPPQYQGGAKDFATPLRQWAAQSTANLTRAVLAIAYVHATLDTTCASDTWRQPVPPSRRRLARRALLPARGMTGAGRPWSTPGPALDRRNPTNVDGPVAARCDDQRDPVFVGSTTMPDADLERFHDGYRRHLDQALSEINRGRKRSHWMWFIFPQVTGLGSSSTAAHYAIRNQVEAEAFLGDPILGPGYRTLVDAVWQQVIGRDVSVRELFGRPDDQKLVSSFTLFAGIASDLGDDWAPTVARVDEVLDRAEAEGMPRCPTTQRFLGTDARP